ncbi:MAG: hypothetical protein ACRDQA_28565 [Nocardioidaceae bacterium]
MTRTDMSKGDFDFDACMRQTRWTDALSLSSLPNGNTLCVLTREGHVSIVAIGALPKPDNPGLYLNVLTGG